MNEEEFTALAQTLGQTLGDAAVNQTMALALIVNAIMKQPNFDKAAFQADIRQSVVELSEQNSIVKLMLTALLPETYADHQL